MNVEAKLVDFEKWCKQCKYRKDSEFDPESECYECLEYPENMQTTKPTHYVQDTK